MVTTTPSTLWFLLPYASHFRDAGWRVEAATNGAGIPPKVEAAFDRIWPIPWDRRLLDRRNALDAPRRFRTVIRQSRPDIVHVHTPIAAFVSRVAIATIPKRERPAMVYTAHGFHFHPRGHWLSNVVFKVAEKTAGHWTDRLIVINAEDRRAAERLRIVPLEQLSLFPGIGVDLEWYARTEHLLNDAETLRGRLRAPAEAAIFSMIAEMTPGKNHLATIRALALSGNQRYHLCFAGDGPLRRTLEQEAARLGVAERVHFLGLVADPRPLILASVATLLPSRREGLSRAVLESVALGVPVLGGNIRGIAEIIGDDAGVLIDPDDIDALVAGLDMFASGWSRAKMDAARVRLQEYSIDNLIDLHVKAYEALLDRW